MMLLDTLKALRRPCRMGLSVLDKQRESARVTAADNEAATAGAAVVCALMVIGSIQGTTQ